MSLLRLVLNIICGFQSGVKHFHLKLRILCVSSCSSGRVLRKRHVCWSKANHVFLFCLVVWHLRFCCKSKGFFFVITLHCHKYVQSWPLMDTQKPPFLTFTQLLTVPEGSPSVDITEDPPHYWNQSTLRTSNLCLVCVWPECLTCCAVLIKRSPLWVVASLWCEVWLKVRGCLYAALWDQPTSPCLCLLLLTQSWWVYTMAHMSLTYVHQWVGVCIYEKKGQIWKTTLNYSSS